MRRHPTPLSQRKKDAYTEKDKEKQRERVIKYMRVEFLHAISKAVHTCVHSPIKKSHRSGYFISHKYGLPKRC